MKQISRERHHKKIEHRLNPSGVKGFHSKCHIDVFKGTHTKKTEHQCKKSRQQSRQRCRKHYSPALRQKRCKDKHGNASHKAAHKFLRHYPYVIKAVHVHGSAHIIGYVTRFYLVQKIGIACDEHPEKRLLQPHVCCNVFYRDCLRFARIERSVEGHKNKSEEDLTYDTANHRPSVLELHSKPHLKNGKVCSHRSNSLYIAAIR